MEVQIIGKDFKVTDGIREYLNKKLDRIEKYFEEVRADVTLKAQKNIQTAEIQVYTPDGIFRAATEDKDLYAAIDKDIDVLEGQIRKYKTKREKQNRDQTIKALEIPDEKMEIEDEILKTQYYELKPMTEEDAKLKLKEEKTHNFLVFLNGNTNKVNVIYKLKDNKNFGLVEPEN